MSDVYARRIARERVRLQLACGETTEDVAHGEIARLTHELRNGEQDPIAALASRLGLERRSEDFLAFVVACSADPASAAALMRLQGTSSHYGATIASYVKASSPRDAGHELTLSLAREHPLVTSFVIESRSDSSTTLAQRVWSVVPRVVRFLTGDEVPAEPLVSIEMPELALFDDPQRGQIDQLAKLLGQPRPVTILIEGPSGSGRSTSVAAAALRLGRSMVELPLDRVDRSLDTFERGLRALYREAGLTGAIPVIRGVDELEGVEDVARRRRLEEFIATLPMPVVLTTRVTGQALKARGDLVRLTWSPPSSEARRNMWEVLLAQADPDHRLQPLDIDELGHRYTIGPGAMRDAIESIHLTGSQLTIQSVVDALRHRTTERLTGLTTLVAVRHDWSDLVLARDTRDQIDALVARVRHSHQVLERWGLHKRVGRATGVAALFSGPPGTGKTMVAGLVARELGLDVHQVELSTVVSKWIGETEKQLAQIFDAAGSGHCLLLFDEADALFTKRTEVKSSTDRYSNLEVNFLLQRLEAFSGIVILTTNLETSLDPAFKRRLAAHIVFWPPDDEERTRLWRGFLGTGVPLANDIDIEKLVADFRDLSGAHIRNAVLSAAFAAASTGRPVGQQALESAARSEYATMGRVLARMGR
ncbi:MAG: ATP-binding protein [Deltaproteobacteria bacterium]|nr:ATP-binding protein [Deltaproteobacteria bacterium]